MPTCPEVQKTSGHVFRSVFCSAFRSAFFVLRFALYFFIRLLPCFPENVSAQRAEREKRKKKEKIRGKRAFLIGGALFPRVVFCPPAHVTKSARRKKGKKVMCGAGHMRAEGKNRLCRRETAGKDFFAPPGLDRAVFAKKTPALIAGVGHEGAQVFALSGFSGTGITGKRGRIRRLRGLSRSDCRPQKGGRSAACYPWEGRPNRSLHTARRPEEIRGRGRENGR